MNLCGYHKSLLERADSCWEKIIKTEGYDKTLLLFRDTWDIYLQAVETFSAGYFLPSAVMCRVSLETALHAVLSVREPKYNKDNDGNLLLTGFSHDPSLDSKSLSNLIKSASDKGYLEGELEHKAELVKENGDFAAHLGERFWKNVDQLSKSPNGGKDQKPLRLWVSEEESVESLEDTATLLSHLIGKFFEETMPEVHRGRPSSEV